MQTFGFDDPTARRVLGVFVVAILLLTVGLLLFT